MEYCNLEKYLIYFKTLSSKNSEYEGKCKLMWWVFYAIASGALLLFKTDFPWKRAIS